MSQSRALSAIEAMSNLAVAASLVFFPAIGISVAQADNLRLGALFTGLSRVCSYMLRRLFARLGRRAPGTTGGCPCRAIRSN